MATFTIYGQIDVELAASSISIGALSSARGARVTFLINYPELAVSGQMIGSFISDTGLSSGNLVGGTVTGVNYTRSGAPVMTVSGLNFSVADLKAQGSAYSLILGGDDQFFGSALGDRIGAGAGADTVVGLDGDDIVNGSLGNDDVNGNKGEDLVHGDAGADTVRGGQGNDTVYGDDGDDGHVNGNLGDDSVLGGMGDDTCYGGQGADTLGGYDGDDLLSGDLGDDVLYGGIGADRFMLRAGGGADAVMDFNSAQGDRIVLQPGAQYSLSSVNGGMLISVGADSIHLSYILPASFDSAWIIFA